MEKDTIYGPYVIGCLVEPENAINIDSIADWIKAEQILKQRERAGLENSSVTEIEGQADSKLVDLRTRSRDICPAVVR